MSRTGSIEQDTLKFLFGKCHVKGSIGRHRFRVENNIKTDCYETMYKVFNSIALAWINLVAGFFDGCNEHMGTETERHFMIG